jgi:single-strand DNA-binding protein
MQDINTVALTGNLTRDPELKQTPGGSICRIRVANNGRKKDGDQWVDAPNFFDVVVWGAQGENVAQYLSKGRKVAITGKLRWREWESDNGKRQAVEIHADNVAFIGGREEGGSAPAPASSGTGVGDFASTGAPASDDIPF